MFGHIIAKSAAIIEQNTLHRFFKMLAWSFMALYKGEWPYADWDHVVYAKASALGKKVQRHTTYSVSTLSSEMFCNTNFKP